MKRETTRFAHREDWLPHWEQPGATYHLRTSTLPEAAGLLATERVAPIVTACLEHDVGRRYTLYAYVIMPDHLHMLLAPARRGEGFVPVAEIMKTLKGVSSRRINQALGRSGSF